MIIRDDMRLGALSEDTTSDLTVVPENENWFTTFTSGLKNLSTGAASVITAVEGKPETPTPTPSVTPKLRTASMFGGATMLYVGAAAIGAFLLLGRKRR